MTNKVIPVILSGGSGSRLWPLSRADYPKQYLSLNTDHSMFQETILRLKDIPNIANPVIVCSDQHRFLVAEQLQQIDIDNPTIILEPTGRNTAPAITAAVMQLAKNGSNDIIFVLPSDHVIQDIERFHKAIQIAVKQATAGKLVTFGVVPTSPNLNYGYIKKVDSINNYYKVEEFIEKPNQKNAEEYCKNGNYLWNSGMFIFKVDTFLLEISQHSIEMVKKVEYSVMNATIDFDFIRLEGNSFKTLPSASIDYELMEKTENVEVVPLDVGWSDLGSWGSLYEFNKKDLDGNVIKGDVHTFETTDSYIHSYQNLVVTIGLKEMYIINTPDVTFISNRKDISKVQEILSQLNDINRNEHSQNRKVYRPWGWFDPIEIGKNYKVKRLHVKPGAKLSLQFHAKRAEHWVVVKGVATITNGDNELTLSDGQSTYIPKGVKHSLKNMENESLEVIEIQSGSYLGEDDIVRIEDIYGRKDL